MKKFFTAILFVSILLTGCVFGHNENITPNTIGKFRRFSSLSANERKLLNSGIKKLQSEDVTGAIIDFQNLTNLHPNLAIAHYNLGLAYSKNNQLPQAINCWEKSVSIDNKYADAYYNLGLAYKILHNNKKAAENLTGYILLNPEDNNIHQIKNEIINLNELYAGNGIIGRISISDKSDPKNNVVLDAKNLFNPDTPTIYTSIEVISAPENTEMEVNWYYITDEGQKFPVNLAKLRATGSENLLLSISKPETGWPAGKYEIDIFVNNNINTIVPFSILR